MGSAALNTDRSDAAVGEGRIRGADQLVSTVWDRVVRAPVVKQNKTKEVKVLLNLSGGEGGQILNLI